MINMQLCDHQNCTGCGLCEEICTRNAISFHYDELGFRFPVINKELCVDCGLCKKKCPELNPLIRESDNQCFIAWAKDNNTHYESASGGVSYVLAQSIIRDGGFSIGCVWDEDFNAVLEVIDNEIDLKKSIGSKYVQSYITHKTWCNIRKKINEGKQGIVFGLPCQVAAIKSFTNNCDNLIFCEILCHGGSSPRIHKIHFEEILHKNKIKNVSDIKFRGGDYNFYYTIWCRHKPKYIDVLKSDSYYYSFIKHRLFHESCYQCQYARKDRISDITIGDFWGIDPNFVQEKNVLNGTNLVIVHNSKGKRLWEKVDQEIVSYKRSIEEAVKGNDTLKKPTEEPIDRKQYLKMISDIGFEKTMENDPLYIKEKKAYRKTVLKLRIRNRIPEWMIRFIHIFKFK